MEHDATGYQRILCPFECNGTDSSIQHIQKHSAEFEQMGGPFDQKSPTYSKNFYILNASLACQDINP